MTIIITLLIIVLIVSAFASLGIVAYVWPRPEIRGRYTFLLTNLLLMIWNLVYAFQLQAEIDTVRFILARGHYVGLLAAPAMLFFTLSASRKRWHLSWWATALIFVAPVMTNIAVWLAPVWIWEGFEWLTLAVDTKHFYFDYTRYFYAALAINYITATLIPLVVFKYALDVRQFTRPHIVLVLLVSVAPFVANVLFIFSGGLDWTPPFLTLACLMTGWVVYDIRPISITPVAYEAAFQNLPDPAVTVDVNNNIQLLNPAGERQMLRSGRDPERVKEKSIQNVMPQHWFELIEKANEVETLSHEVVRDSSGYPEYFDMQVTPLHDKLNNFKGRLFVIRDVSVRKEKQLALAEREKMLAVAVEEQTAKLRRVNEGLIQAVRTKDEFLAGMSHELRTPLNAIIGTSESINASVYGEVPNLFREPLNRIDQSASHLLELITDILDVSKIEAGNLELAAEPVDLEEICNTCIKLIQYEASKKQIEIAFSIEVQQHVINADPRRLRQILFNLLSNAIKFTPGGGQVGLQVREASAEQMTIFTVWDTGIGIAKEDRERIFDSFVQVDSTLSRKYDGTGLGLALTRDLVEMHGGKTSVLSKLGIGSRFSVTLPWSIE